MPPEFLSQADALLRVATVSPEYGMIVQVSGLPNIVCLIPDTTRDA